MPQPYIFPEEPPPIRLRAFHSSMMRVFSLPLPIGTVSSVVDVTVHSPSVKSLPSVLQTEPNSNGTTLLYRPPQPCLTFTGIFGIKCRPIPFESSCKIVSPLDQSKQNSSSETILSLLPTLFLCSTKTKRGYR